WPLLADCRSSTDSIESLLNSAQLPSSRERQARGVEPSVIVMYRPAVPDAEPSSRGLDSRRWISAAQVQLRCPLTRITGTHARPPRNASRALHAVDRMWRWQPVRIIRDPMWEAAADAFQSRRGATHVRARPLAEYPCAD